MRLALLIVGGAILGFLGALFFSLIFMGGIRQDDLVIYLIIGAGVGVASGLSELRRRPA
ncbi:MAG: hypothetical protein U0556_08190 [Dehalococcoidia bacterium]